MATSEIRVLLTLRWWFRCYLKWVALRASITRKPPIPNAWMLKRGVKCEPVRPL